MMKVYEIDATTIYRCPIVTGAYNGGGQSEVASPRRVAEVAAVTAMLCEIFGESAYLNHDEYGAPVLSGVISPPFLSISHSAREVVVAVNPVARIGVDVEHWRSQLMRVASRFLSEGEAGMCRSSHDLLRAWTVKEALYKAYRKGSLPLADGCPLPPHPGATTMVGGGEYRVDMVVDTPSTCIALATSLEI